MKTNLQSFIFPQYRPLNMASVVAATLLFGTLAVSAQTGDFLYSGSEQTITLNPGFYDITAYGGVGGGNGNGETFGGLAAEMGAEFDFSTTTTLTLLVGGEGDGGPTGDGGGGGSFVVNGTTPLVVAGGGGGAGYGGTGGNGSVGTSGGDGGEGGGNGGEATFGGNGGGYDGGGGGGYVSTGAGGYYANGGGAFLQGGGAGTSLDHGRPGGYGCGGAGSDDGGGGGGGYSGGGGGYGIGSITTGGGGGGGGSYIDSSAIEITTEVSGVTSPDGIYTGEIIITAVPEPGTLVLAGLGGLSLLLLPRRRN